MSGGACPFLFPRNERRFTKEDFDKIFSAPNFNDKRKRKKPPNIKKLEGLLQNSVVMQESVEAGGIAPHNQKPKSNKKQKLVKKRKVGGL